MATSNLWAQLMVDIYSDPDWSRLPDGDMVEDYTPEEDDYSEDSDADSSSI